MFIKYYSTTSKCKQHLSLPRDTSSSSSSNLYYISTPTRCISTVPAKSFRRPICASFGKTKTTPSLISPVCRSNTCPGTTLSQLHPTRVLKNYLYSRTNADHCRTRPSPFRQGPDPPRWPSSGLRPNCASLFLFAFVINLVRLQRRPC